MQHPLDNSGINVKVDTLDIYNRHEHIENLRKTLQQTELIPPLPETASKILVLRNKSDANLDELVQLIERDPTLAAFIMKYARMAIFGYGDRITSVTHAVSLVLGYATALNITLGIASNGSLRIPNYGPLGRVQIWSDALQCAQLCREFSMRIAKKQAMDPGLAYLCGLFHNFGYFLFAHYCPDEFANLNEMVYQSPDQDVRVLELRHFGVTHDYIGLRLLKAWNLPEEVIIVAGKHHNPDCTGKHVLYVKLVAAVNRLLHQESITDACDHIETSALFEELGLNESEAEIELQKILACQGDMTQLAQELMA